VFFIVLGCGAVSAALLGGLRLWVEGKYRDRIYYDLEEVVPCPTGIVLGAGLWPDGSLTPVLADRVATAADLYHAGTVQTLIFSGAARPGHDEPQAMLDHALRLGVPAEAVHLDGKGHRTYDTCYRARQVFGVERAVVVTQRFHVARTLYLCDALGVDAVAAVADRRPYSLWRIAWEAREYLALLRAWWEVKKP
jgi:SanA protein